MKKHRLGRGSLAGNPAIQCRIFRNVRSIRNTRLRVLLTHAPVLATGACALHYTSINDEDPSINDNDSSMSPPHAPMHAADASLYTRNPSSYPRDPTMGEPLLNDQ